MIRSLAKLWAAIGALLILSSLGCGGRGTLPKTFPAEIWHWQGKLDHVEFLHDFNITDYAQVRVQEVSTSKAALPPADENTYEPTKRVLERATAYFADGVHQKVPTVAIGQGTRVDARTLLVRASVDAIDPGSWALRFWVGAGNVSTHVSGDVSDAATGETLLRFQSSWSDNGGGGLGMGGYQALMGAALRRSGRDVGLLLSSFTPVKQ